MTIIRTPQEKRIAAPYWEEHEPEFWEFVQTVSREFGVIEAIQVIDKKLEEELHESLRP